MLGFELVFHTLFGGMIKKTFDKYKKKEKRPSKGLVTRESHSKITQVDFILTNRLQKQQNCGISYHEELG